MEECLICFSPFTSKVRKAISCPHCHHSSCMKCLQRYTLESFNEPDCPHCRKPWSLLFLRTNLPKTFIDGDFAKRRQDILWSKAQSFIPEIQTKIEREKENEKKARIYYGENIQGLKLMLIDLESMRNKLENTLDEILYKYIKVSKKDHEEIKAKYNTVSEQVRKMEREISLRKVTFNDILNGDSPEGEEEKERKLFRRKCTYPECKGWINGSWKCGICENYTCKDCFEVIGKVKNPSKDGAGPGEQAKDPHVCKEEHLETAKLIRESTKPCPKCGEGIEKLSGCDVMFCMACHTGFSWTTGKLIEERHIHNPHYFEWVTANPIPREDEVECVRFEPRTILRAFVKTDLEKSYQKVLFLIRHIEDYELGRYNYAYTTEDLLRSYLLNEKEKDEVQRNLQVRERRVERERSIREVLDMFVQAAKELVMDAVRHKDNANQRLIDLNRLREFSNETLEGIGKLYGCVVPYLNQTGDITSHSPSRKRNDPDGANEGAGIGQ